MSDTDFKKSKTPLASTKTVVEEVQLNMELGFGLAEAKPSQPKPVENPAPEKHAGPIIISRLAPAQPTKVYDTYWRFAVERQNIFFRKKENAKPPWTTDSILAKYKFTNAYRASDRVSQYLIKEVIYKGDQSIKEVFFRIILFKIFNKIETWKLLLRDLDNSITFENYSFDRYDTILTQALGQGTTIFSAAYIMPSRGKGYTYPKKHRNFLKVLEKMMADEMPFRISSARSMRQAFELLRDYPMLGDFLAYQYVTDLNYSELTNFSETEFVIPGPGARNGLQKCFSSFGGLNLSDIIRLVTEQQNEEFERLGLKFCSLWGRPLQLIDCQNLFCEVDKYSRVAHPEIKGITDRTRIKQIYQSKITPIAYMYPIKWGLNDLIKTRASGKES